MTNHWDRFMAWVRSPPPWTLALSVVSILLFIGTLVAVPVLVLRMKPDHFIVPSSPMPLWKRLARLVAASVLIVAGIAMLFLPGQGVLTIILGLSLLDTPWKRRIQYRLLTIPSVWRAMNRMRLRMGAEPFIFPHDDASFQRARDRSGE